MSSFQNTNKAFTLAEILVTMVIIGVIASFGLPSYQLAVEQGNERKAAIKLLTITRAMEVYKATHGTYVDYDLNDINEINAALGTQIEADENWYFCGGFSWNSYCLAEHDVNGSHWILHSTSSENGAVHCDSATCPACTSILPHPCPEF